MYDEHRTESLNMLTLSSAFSMTKEQRKQTGQWSQICGKFGMFLKKTL